MTDKDLVQSIGLYAFGDQWKVRLSEHMRLTPREVGQLASGRRNLTARMKKKLATIANQQARRHLICAKLLEPFGASATI